MHVTEVTDIYLRQAACPEHQRRLQQAVGNMPHVLCNIVGARASVFKRSPLSLHFEHLPRAILWESLPRRGTACFF